MVSNVFEKPNVVKSSNNNTIDHVDKCCLFSNFQYGFKSSWSAADFLTVVYDRTVRAFNRSWATHAVALDVSKSFDMLIFFTNLILIEFQIRHLALLLLFSVIGGFKWFLMGNFHKNVQLMLEFFKAPFLVLHFSSYTFITLLMKLSAMFLSMLMVLLSILSVNRYQRQQLELASELEFDLQNTMDWAKK